MSLPITWSGAPSVSAASEIDSDAISLAGAAGFSAIATVAGLANGNLQIMASNGGAAVSLGVLSVNVAAGGSQNFAFSFESQFYASVWLRWTPTGPPSTGTLSGNWSLSGIQPSPAAPTPSATSASGAVSSSATSGLAATQPYLAGVMLGLFPPSWVPDAAKGSP